MSDRPRRSAGKGKQTEVTEAAQDTVKKKGASADAVGGKRVIPSGATARALKASKDAQDALAGLPMASLSATPVADDTKAHPADGGCIAEVFKDFGVYKTSAKAAKVLDDATVAWRAGTDLREDQKNEMFLGEPGVTWHMQIVKRCFIAAGYDFLKVIRMCPACPGHVLRMCSAHQISHVRAHL